MINSTKRQGFRRVSPLLAKFLLRARSVLCDRTKGRGFTLVETLLVVSLFCVIAVAVYQSLAAGLKIWQRYRFFKEGEVLLFFDKAGQELRNALIYSKIPFEGSAARVAFPVLVKVPMDKKKSRVAGEWEWQIGRVEYFFDQQKHTLYRRQANYSQALRNIYGKPQMVVTNLKSATFRYFHRDGESFKEFPATDHLPNVLLLRANFDNPMEQELFKHVNIPTGH